MSKNTNKSVLLILAILAVLLLASLIGNVVLLSMLKSTHSQLSAAKTELTDTQYELSQYKSGAKSAEAKPEAEAEPEAEPAAEPATEAEPGTEAEPETEPATEAPTEAPTAKPTATPEPTPAGPYAGSKLDVTPQPAEEFTETKVGTVACSLDVNIRSGPGTGYGKLASVSSGSQLNVRASVYGWFLVEYKHNTYGWISGQYFFADWMFESGLNTFLKDIEPAKEYLTAPEKVTVTAENGANARSGAATAKELVLRLDNGETGVCLAHNGDWYFCNFKGTYCWVHKSNFQ